MRMAEPTTILSANSSKYISSTAENISTMLPPTSSGSSLLDPIYGSGSGSDSEEPEEALGQLVCETYGISLDEFHAGANNHNNEIGHGVAVNESFYGNSNDTSSTMSGSSLASLGIDLNVFGLGGGGGGLHGDNNSVCSNHWDKILCWPETPVGHMARLPCFKFLNEIEYDTTYNATRFCNSEGIWNSTNYDQCKPFPPPPPSDNGDLLALTTTVYFFGYSLSLAAVIIAMIIFLAFKELRCLRNTIHTHLIVTYILADTLWIITSSTTFSLGPSAAASIPDLQAQGTGQNHVSCVTYILLHYFHLTNFFWMFVEGLYLYVLVVQTFVAENIKLRVYVSIGWGIPLALIIIWAIARGLAHEYLSNNLLPPQGAELDSCVWLSVSLLDWIFKFPAIFTLAVNSLFLVQIMWVLITKLRSATNPETQQSVKAAKALVVLMPLLGIPYLLMLAGSNEHVYEFVRALFISTQGFCIALFYCFLNGEVRKALRHRWNRLRTMGPNNCCDFRRRRQMQQMRDWSPRSRTESIRLYTPANHTYRKRESSASEATTMTTLHGSMNSNGMGHRLSTTYLPPPSVRFTNNANNNAVAATTTGTNALDNSNTFM